MAIAKTYGEKESGAAIAGAQLVDYRGVLTKIAKSAIPFGTFVSLDGTNKEEVLVGQSGCFGVSAISKSASTETGYAAKDTVPVLTRGSVTVATSGACVVGGVVYVDSAGKLTGTATSNKVAHCRVLSYDSTNNLAGIILSDIYPLTGV